MPILKHARKKLKQDKKRTLQNKKVKNALKDAVKNAKSAKNPKSVSAAFKAIDKATKANIIHKNKAARMKSSLSKLIAGKPAAKKTEAKPAKAAPKTKPAVKTATKPAKSSGAKKKSSSKTK